VTSTTFPNGKNDDQADSTSQALNWATQTTYTYGLLEYYRLENLRRTLGLASDYRFVQSDEDEEIIAAHRTSGHKIRWTGQFWTPLEPEKGELLFLLLRLPDRRAVRLGTVAETDADVYGDFL
jgi:hypothetical protein